MASSTPEIRRGILVRLQDVLSEAREAGFLGPGPVEDHVYRALDLGAAVGRPPSDALDLGSGGGVPGLPLMLLWPTSRWVLLDGSVRRADFLGTVLVRLGLSDRGEVRAERAEVAGRSPLRGRFDLVVARGFGSPAVTAECASPFLVPGGQLIVAEPPGGAPERWDAEGLRKLGMAVDQAFRSPTAFQVLNQEVSCPERYPRRVGVPSKRPLW